MYNSKIKKILIDPSYTILQTIKKMDEIDKKILLIVKNQKYIGLVSIGDIQRAMLKSISLDEGILKILRKDTFVGKESNSKKKLIDILLKQRVEFIPIVSKENEVLEILFWEDYSNEHIFKTNALRNHLF